MRSLLPIASMALFAVDVAMAMAGPPQRYRLDAAQENVVEISGLDNDNWARAARPTRGKVVKRDFDKSGLVLSSLVIELHNGDRELVNVFPDLDQVPAVDKGWMIRGLQRLTREWARVSLSLSYCGAAGRVVILDRISAY